MKTIQISDEMFEALSDLAKEYVTQDNRATAMPYLFQIQTTELVPAAEGCGETHWIDEEGDVCNEEDIKNIISQEKGWEDEEALTEEQITEKYKKIDFSEIREILENKCYREIDLIEANKYENAFLTAKGCKKHIELNSYHYSQPVDYLNCGWRNPELELISNLLIHIAKSNGVKPRY